MKVLVLTNPEHQDFVRETAHGYTNERTEFFWGGEYPFPAVNNYDIGISFMYQHKVPAKEVNTHTWFNFHPAPLPEYKGRDLCYWAIMNNEKEFGATLHYMDENFDTGDIIDVIKFPVMGHWTARDVSAFAIEFSKRMFEIYFPRIIAGEQFERLPNVGGHYYPKGRIPTHIAFTDRDATPKLIRAMYCPPHYPKINIGGVNYKIVRDE